MQIYSAPLRDMRFVLHELPVGLVALLSGATLVGQVAVGAALVAALLNAVFAFCLGCEVYLLVRRFIATV